MTCSLALRNPRLFAPEYPDAFSSTARRCFLPWTERFTLAIVTASCVAAVWRRSCLGPAQQTLDVLLVGARDLGAATEATRPPARLLLEQVGTKRLAAPDLARPGDLVSLGCPPVRLHLRHHCAPSLPGPGGSFGRVQHHRHVAAVLPGCGLDHGDLADLLGDALQDPQAELRVEHLPTAEHDRELDL